MATEAPCFPRPLAAGGPVYVYSTTHRRNLGKTPLAHIGVKERGGLNYMPLCGWRANGPTATAAEVPPGLKACRRCLAKLEKLA